MALEARLFLQHWWNTDRSLYFPSRDNVMWCTYGCNTGCPTCQKEELYNINTPFVLIVSSKACRNRWKDLDWHYWPIGTITKRADQNVLFHLLSSSSPSFSSYSLKSSFKILIHLRFSFSPISSVVLPYLCSACSSSSFPFLLFLSCPAPLPSFPPLSEGAALHSGPLPPPRRLFSSNL